MSKMNPIEFQICDFIEDHEDEEYEDSDDNEKTQKVYIIHTFGRTLDGKSVYMKIKNYTPYFYIKIPNKWTEDEVEDLYEYFTSKKFKDVKQFAKDHLMEIRFVKKKTPEGFTNGKSYKFAQLVFNNYFAMKQFKYAFEKETICWTMANGSYTRPNLFQYEEYDDKKKYDDDIPKFLRVSRTDEAPTHLLKISNYKGGKQLAAIIRNDRIFIDGFKKFESFKIDNKKFKIPDIFDKPTVLKTYESNFAPMLRCFHIRKVSGCAWVNIKKYNKVPDIIKQTHCDIEIEVDWRNVVPIEKNAIAPFRILSYDIECYSCDGEFPQAYRKDDKIIQIGSTYTYVNQSLPYRQHIVCLGETSPIDNVIVESYKNERELIKGWIKEVIDNDCDIITGYNIFFFDEAYIYDRCDKILNMKNEILLLSKFKYRQCNFRDFKLASAAMGENRIRMFDTPGRIHIDLMKDIQKNHKLDSYKLDNVSSHFIRNQIYMIKKIKINKITHLELHCVQIKDIFIGDFIHLEQKLDFISDNIGNKYEIVNIENNIITIKNHNDIDEFFMDKEFKPENKSIDKNVKYYDYKAYKFYCSSNKIDYEDLDVKNSYTYSLWWSQAKDDVGPKDIFRLWQGTPDDRAIVAKYCIKDCRLVNLLLNKLKVVGNNIEMSNVCFVPLGYLFTRGQLIKLFSLCMKVFRENGYIIPTRKKGIIKIPSYEGAIVFDPEPRVEYEALAVKDYSSLYPSSIIHKNMSHETIVYDDKYDNLPGIEYFNAKFVDYDGSIQYRRFAKEKGKFGIVPTILQTLLGERKKVKKEMKTENDPFIHSMLNSKQLALKVTANSLYGAVGADISAVCQRDIAACTTSTGREMLIFAKEYDENIVPGLFNGMKKALLDNDMNKFNKFIDMELKHKDDKFIEKLKKFLLDIKDYTFQPIIRYGDSVIGDTPLLLMKDNKIFIKKIKDLTDKYYSDNNKEYGDIEDIFTWTEKGWTKINRIMRHKLEINKELYRVTTHQGSVVVTDEHSLLDNSGNEVTIKNLKEGDTLLHSFPTKFNSYDYDIFNKKINNDISRLLGYFMGDGSCGYYEKCKKSSWALNGNNIKLLKYYKNILDTNFPEYNWKILNTIKSSNVYKLVISKKSNSYKIVDFIKEFRKLLYTPDKEKKVPDEILNNSKEIKYNFWIGLYDGYKTNYGKLTEEWNNDGLFNKTNDKKRCGQFIDQKGYVSSLSIFFLAQSLGYNTSINTRKDKLNVFRIRVSEKLRKPYNVIKKIEKWTENEEYVYDLTTENHHFHAGVGSIIVHNTDSIFSCYRYKEKGKLLPKENQLKLFKSMIKFSKKLMMPFINKEYQTLFNDLHNQYYNYKLIKDLILPDTLETKPEPTHYNIIESINDRMKRFLVIYMKEFYFPWLWTLQDIFNKRRQNEYNTDEIFKDALNVKLFNHGCDLVRKLRIEPEECSDNMKNDMYRLVKEFIDDEIRYNYIQPYWDIDNDNIIYKYEIVKGGKKITDKRTLIHSIDMGVMTGEMVKSRLPFPHDLEYEKTFWPFLILTKKRYVGNKYEFNPDKYKQDYNGIVLKRRDNAPIVKKICGGIIDCLISERNPEGARKYTKDCIRKMIKGQYNIKYFITSKTLKMKNSYADWTRIAHAVLADRIEKRDPGNAPQSGDRIDFATIKVPGLKKGALQGERIETPQYIKDNNLQLDYEFYMTNQIMNPALQFLELAIIDAPKIFDEFKKHFAKQNAINEAIRMGYNGVVEFLE
jgi:DNA polymerase elongation subunit (family B)